jgi:hypothetical protein
MINQTIILELQYDAAMTIKIPEKVLFEQL